MTHTCGRTDPAKPAPMWLQDGWREGRDVYGQPTRVPNMVSYQPKPWLDLPCQYTRAATDPDCPADCPRKPK